MTEKLQKFYEHLAKELNSAIGAKDMHKYDDIRGNLMTLEVHVLGKNTLDNYRSLFTFSGALFIAMNNY
jgi:hypothetical protein